jgi:hypothetical protein
MRKNAGKRRNIPIGIQNGRGVRGNVFAAFSDKIIFFGGGLISYEAVS